MWMRRSLLAGLLVAALGMVSCGGGNSPIVVAPPVAGGIQGNWHLLGGFGELKAPNFSLAIATNGNQIYGTGAVASICPGDPFGASGGFGVTLQGVIAADGSFAMKSAAGSTPTVVVNGKVPAVGATAWSGSYESKLTGGSCPFDDKETFTAARLPDLTGTYTGTLTGIGLTGIGVTAKITQGTPVAGTTISGATVYTTPLSASVTVSGTSCFTKGETIVPAAGEVSTVSGDYFDISLRMDDGSQLNLSGNFADVTGKTLLANSFVEVGSCKGDFWFGNLVAGS